MGQRPLQPNPIDETIVARHRARYSNPTRLRDQSVTLAGVLVGASVVLTETLELGLGLAEAALRRLEVPEEAAREALASGRRQDPDPTSERPKT